MASYTKLSMIRGYHVYQSTWTAVVGEELVCARELRNPQDPFAVTVTKSGNIVGHLPRKISSACAMFLQKDGRIDCQVLGTRQYSAYLPQGGLEIPCLLKFLGDKKDVEKLKKIIEFADSARVALPKRELETEKAKDEPPKKKEKLAGETQLRGD